MEYKNYLDRIMADDTIVSITGESTGVSATKVNETADKINAVYETKYGKRAGEVESPDEEEESSSDDLDTEDEDMGDEDMGSDSEDEDSELDADNSDAETPEGEDTEDLDKVDGGSMSMYALNRTPAWMRRHYSYLDNWEYSTPETTTMLSIPGMEDAADVIILDSEVGPGGESTEPGSRTYDKKRLDKISGDEDDDGDGDAGGDDAGGDDDFDMGDDDDFDMGDDDLDMGDEEDTDDDGAEEMRLVPGAHIKSHESSASKMGTLVLDLYNTPVGMTCIPTLYLEESSNGRHTTYTTARLSRLRDIEIPTTSAEMKSAIKKYVATSINKTSKLLTDISLTTIINPVSYNNIIKRITATKSYAVSPAKWANHAAIAKTVFLDKSGILPSERVASMYRSEQDNYRFSVDINERNILTDITYRDNLGTVRTLRVNEPLVRRCAADESVDDYVRNVVRPVINNKLATSSYLFANDSFSYLVTCNINKIREPKLNPTGAYAAMESFVYNICQGQVAEKVLTRYRNDSIQPNKVLGATWCSLFDDTTPTAQWNDVERLTRAMRSSTILSAQLAKCGYVLDTSTTNFKILAKPAVMVQEQASHWCHFDKSFQPIVGEEALTDSLIALVNLATKAVVGAWRIAAFGVRKLTVAFLKRFSSLEKLIKYYKFRLTTFLDDMDEKLLDKETAESHNREVIVAAISVMVDTFRLARNCDNVVFAEGDEVVTGNLKEISDAYNKLGVDIDFAEGEVKTTAFKDKVKKDTLRNLGFDKTNIKSVMEQLLELRKFFSKEEVAATERATTECAKTLRRKMAKLQESAKHSDDDGDSKFKAAAGDMSVASRRMDAIAYSLKVVNLISGAIIDDIHNVFTAFDDAIGTAKHNITDVKLLNPHSVYDKEKILAGDVDIKVN